MSGVEPSPSHTHPPAAAAAAVAAPPPQVLREEIEREREVIATERDALEAKKRRLREAAAAEKLAAKARLRRLRRWLASSGGHAVSCRVPPLPPYSTHARLSEGWMFCVCCRPPAQQAGRHHQQAKEELIERAEMLAKLEEGTQEVHAVRFSSSTTHPAALAACYGLRWPRPGVRQLVSAALPRRLMVKGLPGAAQGSSGDSPLKYRGGGRDGGGAALHQQVIYGTRRDAAAQRAAGAEAGGGGGEREGARGAGPGEWERGGGDEGQGEEDGEGDGESGGINPLTGHLLRQKERFVTHRSSAQQGLHEAGGRWSGHAAHVHGRASADRGAGAVLASGGAHAASPGGAGGEAPTWGKIAGGGGAAGAAAEAAGGGPPASSTTAAAGGPGGGDAGAASKRGQMSVEEILALRRGG